MKTKSIIFNLAMLVALALAGVWTVPAQAASPEVWVCPSGDCGHGGDGFNTIQAGITAVNAGGTIHVAAGIYVEVGQIVISKNLTIVGADKATTIIKTNQDTGSSGDPKGWFLVQATFNFNLSNVTLDGTGHKIWQGIRDYGSSTIDNVIFTQMQYEPSGGSYAGTGVAAFGGSGANVNITNSSFDNIGRVGVLYYGAGQTGTFDDNVYTGKGPGNWLDYGVEVGAGAHATITNNTISGNQGVATSDGSTSAGILVTTYYGGGSQATITGNTITGNTTGIAVGYDASDTSVVTAHNNAIYNNSSAGIDTTSSIVDATSNWWGAASGPGSVGPGTGDEVSLNVDYSSWLTAVPNIVVTTDKPAFCGSADEDKATVSINISDVVDLYGYQFQVAYDKNKVTAVGAFDNSFFDTVGGSIPWNATCATGVCKFSVSKVAPQVAVTGSGIVAKITFTGIAPGAFDVTVSNDKLANRDGLSLIHPIAAPLNLTVCGFANVSGVVSLQGRATPINPGTVTLTDGTFGPYSTNFNATTGAWSINNIKVMPGGTSYTFDAAHSLYLGNQLTHILNPGDTYAAADTKLKGGDANNSGLINVDDLTCVAGAFGLAPVVCGTTGSSDINADATTNILDLVLVGGNYGLATPRTW